MRFPTYPTDILSRADAMLASKYGTSEPIDPVLVEVACEAMMVDDWQPIETAPDGESAVLLWCPDESGEVIRSCYVGWWWKGGWCRAGDDYDLSVEPTHWRPLPNAPIAKAIRGTE